MNRLSILLVLMWFSNWLVTSSAIPINMEAGISLKIDPDDLKLNKGNSSIWLRIRMQFSSVDPRTIGKGHNHPLNISRPYATTVAPVALPTSVATTTVAPVATTALPTTACKDEFSRVGDHCYHFSTTKVTFNNASIACHSLGAALAHPKNSVENSQLTRYIRDHKERARRYFFTSTTYVEAWWIGATDRDNEGRWVWAHDKSPVGYTDWLGGEPNNAHENEHCAHYRRNADHKWNDVPCNNKFKYICQQLDKNDDTGDGKPEEMIPSSTSTTIAPLSVSQSDFVQLGEHSYYFSTTKATWHQAYKACQSIDTQLAHPRNSLENTKLTQYIRENKKPASWWIGATDGDKEGQWVWAHDKSPVGYTDWLRGEPNNEYDNEDCAHLRRDVNYEWNDASCENKHHYICQSEESKEDSQGEPSGEMESSAEVKDEIKHPTINPLRHDQLYPVSRYSLRRGYPWDTHYYPTHFG